MAIIDSKAVMIYLLSSFLIAFGVFTSKTLAPVLWKTIVILAVLIAVAISINYHRIRSVQRILIALALVTCVIVPLGLFLEQTIPDIAVAVVSGYFGSIGIDAIVGKKQDISHI